VDTALGGLVGVTACLFVAVHGGCSSSGSTNGNPAGAPALGGGAGVSAGGSGGATGGNTTGGAGAGGSSGQAAGTGGAGGAGASSGAGSGGAATGGAGAGGVSTGGSAGDAGAPAGGAGCDDYEGLATPEEVATTPRADAEVEILALRAGDVLLAPDDVVARIGRDLAAIRADYTDVATITPRLRASPSSVLVLFDDDTVDDVEADSYTAWDCPNALYRATDISEPRFGGVTITFEGRFEPEILGTEYAKLPGVTNAGASPSIGGGNDISIDVVGESYHWVFIQGSGDCQAGCINHDYWGFTTNADGDITDEGTSVDDSISQDWLDEHLDITSLP